MSYTYFYWFTTSPEKSGNRVGIHFAKYTYTGEGVRAEEEKKTGASCEQLQFREQCRKMAWMSGEPLVSKLAALAKYAVLPGVMAAAVIYSPPDFVLRKPKPSSSSSSSSS